jgi:hypothetical protein
MVQAGFVWSLESLADAVLCAALADAVLCAALADAVLCAALPEKNLGMFMIRFDKSPESKILSAVLVTIAACPVCESPMKQLFSRLLAFICLASFTVSAATVSDPSTAWTQFAGNYDYLADQQTGQKAGDMVGDTTGNYGFFVTFNDNGSASATDGTLGFRLRLDQAGGTKKDPVFDRVAWIGIDADTNGSIDAFLGLNLQGSSSNLLIAAPGTGANTSPNTTTVSNTPYQTYALTTANYNYRPVNSTADGGTTNDVTTTTTGDPDYYVSFMIPFTDVVAFLETSSIQINDQSGLRYVTATSTQTNSLNQDLGGVNGAVNSATTSVDLGGFTQIVTANGTLIPEPSSGLLVIASLTAALFVRRRR